MVPFSQRRDFSCGGRRQQPWFTGARQWSTAGWSLCQEQLCSPASLASEERCAIGQRSEKPLHSCFSAGKTVGEFGGRAGRGGEEAPKSVQVGSIKTRPRGKSAAPVLRFATNLQTACTDEENALIWNTQWAQIFSLRSREWSAEVEGGAAISSDVVLKFTLERTLAFCSSLNRLHLLAVLLNDGFPRSKGPSRQAARAQR